MENINNQNQESGEEKEEVSVVPALERGLNILELLATRAEGFAFSELLSSLNIPRPSLFRLLQELQKRGYVRQNLDTKKYQLGFKILSLSTAILEGIDLRTTARQFLQKLVNQTGETVELVIFDNGELLHIDKIESTQSIRIFAQIGTRNPYLHVSAHGKVFLAYMKDEERGKFLSNKLKKITENTITEKEKLLRELEEVRRDGYAFDFGEGRIDVSRCSAPVFNHAGEIAASVGIAGPAFRMGKDKKQKLGEKVRQIALEISKSIGYQK